MPLPIMVIPTRKVSDYLTSNLEGFIVPLDLIIISFFSLLACATCFSDTSFSALAPTCYSSTTYISNIFVPPMLPVHIFLPLFFEKPRKGRAGTFGSRPGSAASFCVPVCPKDPKRSRSALLPEPAT